MFEKEKENVTQEGAGIVGEGPSGAARETSPSSPAEDADKATDSATAPLAQEANAPAPLDHDPKVPKAQLNATSSTADHSESASLPQPPPSPYPPSRTETLTPNLQSLDRPSALPAKGALMVRNNASSINGTLDDHSDACAG